MKKCSKLNRSDMCKASRDYIDARLEKIHTLHANHGTNSNLDAGDSFEAEVDKLNNEIREFAPDYFKSIAND
ncbi:MAG: hypothetical protein CL833_16235 [Crocinitomicaceae bacterium]|nr:hypothetical protein [Crocinitomicaceae bacterium]